MPPLPLNSSCASSLVIRFRPLPNKRSGGHRVAGALKNGDGRLAAGDLRWARPGPNAKPSLLTRGLADWAVCWWPWVGCPATLYGCAGWAILWPQPTAPAAATTASVRLMAQGVSAARPGDPPPPFGGAIDLPGGHGDPASTIWFCRSAETGAWPSSRASRPIFQVLRS